MAPLACGRVGVRMVGSMKDVVSIARGHCSYDLVGFEVLVFSSDEGDI